MNRATKKLDNTIEDWQLWLKDMGIDVDFDSLDENTIELITNQVDKIKIMLNKEGANSLYLKGLRKKRGAK